MLLLENSTTMLAKYLAVIYFSILFSILFVLHIVFAANDNDLMFRIVAIIITVMIFLCGPICVFFESSKERYKFSFMFGMTLSLFLSIGLGWAYNDMSMGFVMIIFPILSVVIHYIIKQSPAGDTYGLK
tara:strand:- start:229 stop:615 length:387 start_codon:yes stop_codon:yes gene_type:complete